MYRMRKISSVYFSSSDSRQRQRQQQQVQKQQDLLYKKMGNCCARLLYKFTKKSSPKSEEPSSTSSSTPTINPITGKDENWGDWDDVEAPSSTTTTSNRGRIQDESTVPFIHPNTIPSSTSPSPKARPPTRERGPLLKAKAGWVVREKKKPTRANGGLASIKGFNQPTNSSSDPFSSMGMTASYTDDRKIQVKKHSAVLGGGARSLEDNIFMDDGAWGEDEDDEI